MISLQYAPVSLLQLVPRSATYIQYEFVRITTLRSRMDEDRFTGLALLHIHRDIILNVNDVINRFSKEKKRIIDLIL